MDYGTEIRIIKDWPIGQLRELYQAAGWWRGVPGEEAQLARLPAASFAFAVAVHLESGQAVGMGRVLSDGVSDAYIQDVTVLPAFRQRGLGRSIVEALVMTCRSAGIVWIGLIGEPGAGTFYESLGFQVMDGYVPYRLPSPEWP